MRRIEIGSIAKLVAFAPMTGAVLVIGCKNGPGTMTEELRPPDTPDPNTGIAWRLVRTGGGLESLRGRREPTSAA